jgi:hypothetical protein
MLYNRVSPSRAIIHIVGNLSFALRKIKILSKDLVTKAFYLEKS